MSAAPVRPAGDRVIRVAIGTHTGVRVSEHFGHATRFEIWELGPDGGARLVEIARQPPGLRRRLRPGR